jgi:hypothetical protein
MTQGTYLTNFIFLTAATASEMQPMNSPASANTLKGLSGRQLVLDSLSRATSQGLNTVRTWAHTSNKETPFQVMGIG